MKIMARLGGIVTAGLVSVSLGEAEPLKYLGRQGEVPTGWIEFGHEKYYEIGAGTEIPSWGHVVESPRRPHRRGASAHGSREAGHGGTRRPGP